MINLPEYLPQYYGNVPGNVFGINSNNYISGYNPYISSYSLPTFVNNSQARQKLETKSKFCGLLLGRLNSGNDDLLDAYVEQCKIPVSNCCTDMLGRRWDLLPYY